MKKISLDSKGGQWWVDDFLWKCEGDGDNVESLERLKRNLAKAREVALTPRQQQILTLYYDKGLTTGQIALKLNINRSTASRTLRRARKQLYNVLQFSL